MIGNFHLDSADLQELDDRTDLEKLAPFLSHLANACLTCRFYLDEAGLLAGACNSSLNITESHVTDEIFSASLKQGDDPLRQGILLHAAFCCRDCGEEARAVAVLHNAGQLSQDGFLTAEVIGLALSREQAAALAAELVAMGPSAALEAAATDKHFDSWGLAEHLCAASGAVAGADPEQALALADLALAVARQVTPPDLPEDCRQELLMLAHANRSNALRVAEMVDSAAAEMQLAEESWKRTETRRFPYRAEVLSLRMSLERYRRSYTACLETGAEAMIEANANSGDTSPLKARILVKKALVLSALNRPSEAVDVATNATALVHPVKEPRLWLATTQTLLTFLTEEARHEEAQALLPLVIEHAKLHGSPAEILRVKWAEAKVRAGTGHLREAIALLIQVRQGFLKLNLGFTAAVASLELATLYFQQNKLQRVRRLALEILPLFQKEGLYPETYAALSIYREASALQDL